MSSHSYIPGAQQTDTPNGFVCSAPWATVDRTLYVDLKAFLASVRTNRNVLSTRIAVKSKTNVAVDQTFLLPQVASGQLPAEYKYEAIPDNQMTIVSANRPVHLMLTTPNGILDLGQQTLFVITSTIISLTFKNVENAGNAEVNLILV
jgi:hypothetical protein